jgi:SAM-dependent methyltransferase
MNILDIGCGADAKLVRYFTELGKTMYGIDPAVQNSQTTIRQLITKTDSIPFEDSSFDLVISHRNPVYYGVQDGHDKRYYPIDIAMAVLSESFRITKPGGKCIIYSGISNKRMLDLAESMNFEHMYEPVHGFDDSPDFLDRSRSVFTKQFGYYFQITNI